MVGIGTFYDRWVPLERLIKGDGGESGERSFHQPTINKIVFHDSSGEEKQIFVGSYSFFYTVNATT